MSIIIENQGKLSERHEELKRLGKVTAAIERADVSPNTYYRAINGDQTMTAPTLAAILSAQKAVISETKKALQKI